MGFTIREWYHFVLFLCVAPLVISEALFDFKGHRRPRAVLAELYLLMVNVLVFWLETEFTILCDRDNTIL